MNFHRTAVRLASVLVPLALIGCGNRSLDDARYQTGSQTITASSDYRSVYVVNTDAGTVSVMSGSGDLLQKVDVGVEPSRIARAGDKVLVTLRGERGIAVLQEVNGGLEPFGHIDTGAEPFGVVASEDGELAYAAVSTSDQVIEIEMETMQITRSWSVADQPRFIALHPSGKALYIGSAYNGTFTHIDLRGDDRVEAMALPDKTRFKSFIDFEDAVTVECDDFGDCFEREPITMAKRITGDISVSPDGKFIAVPVLFLDNITPAGDGEDGSTNPAPSDGYASDPNGGISRFNPSVVVIPSNNNGTPGIEDSVTPFASGQDLDGFTPVRSYVSSVSFAPDGMVLLATMEGSNTVVTIPRNVADERKVESDEFVFRNTVSVATDAGPRGLAFLEQDRAFVHSFLDNSVADLNYAIAREAIQSRVSGKSDNFLMMEEGFEPIQVSQSVRVEDEVLSNDVADGRRMFYGATDSRMVAKGGGVSCATCHFDGRNDGITWSFSEVKTRQTPSLAGDLSFLEAVTWTDNVPSIAAEVRLTSAGRMGGTGVSITESRQVEAFINSTFMPDTPLAEVADAQAEAGKVLFEREDVGCSTCHTGPNLTDQEPYDLYGLIDVRTPSLLGVSATAPYLHDGRAATLEDVLELSRVGMMGDTSMLSDAELADLAYYLKTL